MILERPVRRGCERLKTSTNELLVPRRSCSVWKRDDRAKVEQLVLKGACALDQVGDELLYPRTLLVDVAFGVLLTFPRAQGKDLVGLGIRHKENLVHEPLLVFKHRDNPILNNFGELSRFSRSSSDGNDSGKHSIPPFGSGCLRLNLCSIRS